MIKNYKNIIKKTEELENDVSNLIQQTEQIKQNPASTFKIRFLNHPINTAQKINLVKLRCEKSVNLTFQLSTKVKISASQRISISLYIDDELISKITKNYPVGEHEVLIYKEFSPIVTKTSNAYILIESLDEKFIYLIETMINVWGITNSNNIQSYNSISVGNMFLISHTTNGELYYKLTNKELLSLNEDDFKYYGKSNQSCFVSLNEQLYLFYIDSNKNLNFSQFFNKSSEILRKNVDFVSAIVFNEKFLVSYISNYQCYTFELKNGLISNHNIVLCVNKKLKQTHLHYNNFTDKVYLVLTDTANQNYLLESLSELFSTSEQLKCSYQINIKTYGGANEISVS